MCDGRSYICGLCVRTKQHFMGPSKNAYLVLMLRSLCKGCVLEGINIMLYFYRLDWYQYYAYLVLICWSLCKRLTYPWIESEPIWLCAITRSIIICIFIKFLTQFALFWCSHILFKQTNPLIIKFSLLWCFHISFKQINPLIIKIFCECANYVCWEIEIIRVWLWNVTIKWI